MLCVNLIWCDKPCIHQSDGLCRLERITVPTASEEGCCYYQPNGSVNDRP